MELRERVIEKLEEAMMLSEASNECKVTLGYGVVEDILALLKAQEPGVDGKSQEVISGFTIYCPNCGFANTCCGTISPRENTVFDCGKCGQAVKLNDRAREAGKRY